MNVRRRMGNRVVHVVVNMRLTGILLRVVKPVKSAGLKKQSIKQFCFSHHGAVRR